MWGDEEEGFYDLTLFLCNTPVEKLTDNYSVNYGGNPRAEVYYAPYELITATADCWVGFDLDQAFQYDGENNLLVEVQWTADGENGTVYSWGWITDGDTYVAGVYDDPIGGVYTLGLRTKLVGEYGPTAVEPASLGRVKVGYR